MSVTASAPGKLVLLGEYAVLEGGPALVLATPQRARVRLSFLPQGPSRLCSRPLLDREVCFEWTPDGRANWLQRDLTATERERLDRLGRLLEGLTRRRWWPRAPLAVDIDTAAFHGADGGKLGLGSSAALTVAMAGAGAAATGNAGNPPLEELVALHRALQQDSGSGIDVAASLHGGALRYRLEQGRPRAEAVGLPAGLHLLAIASGTPVSTPAALEQLREWARAHPDTWGDLRSRLLASAARGAAAVEADATALQGALGEFARCLEELGAVSGLDAYDEVHALPRRLAAEAGAVYKPSGAGGDQGIVASTDRSRVAAVSRRAVAAGIPCFALDGQSAGLRLALSAAEEIPT